MQQQPHIFILQKDRGSHCNISRRSEAFAIGRAAPAPLRFSPLHSTLSLTSCSSSAPPLFLLARKTLLQKFAVLHHHHHRRNLQALPHGVVKLLVVPPFRIARKERWSSAFVGSSLICSRRVPCICRRRAVHCRRRRRLDPIASHASPPSPFFLPGRGLWALAFRCFCKVGDVDVFPHQAR